MFKESTNGRINSKPFPVNMHFVDGHRDSVAELSWDQNSGDFLQEFRRLNAIMGAARGRAELFGGTSESTPLLVR